MKTPLSMSLQFASTSAMMALKNTIKSNPRFLPHSLGFTKTFLPTFPVNLAQLVPQTIDNQDPSSDPIVTNDY